MRPCDMDLMLRMIEDTLEFEATDKEKLDLISKIMVMRRSFMIKEEIEERRKYETCNC